MTPLRRRERFAGERTHSRRQSMRTYDGTTRSCRKSHKRRAHPQICSRADLALLDALPLRGWDNVAGGTMWRVGQCGGWDNVAGGTMWRVGQCGGWDNVA
ncbi:MAG: hypothetical protein AAGF12_43590, partial [Myxococcota bacterium]